jgi:hypothetical protein
MTIATKLINIFNKKFTDHEPEQPTTTKYNDLFLTPHKYVDAVFIDPVPLYNPTKTLDISSLKFTDNIMFIKRVMELRIQEIRKKLVYIKYNIELYKLLLITLHKEKNPIKQRQLQDKRETLMKTLYGYVVKNNGTYLIATTLEKYNFLKKQYFLIFEKENPYFIYQ